MFDVNQYNRLPSITTASAGFNSKLMSSGLTVDTLLEKLRSLLCSDEHEGKYGVWLLHHHFDLEEGERMVKKGAISEPTKDQSPTIVAERWSNGGDELEHVYIGNSDGSDFPPPPPPTFIKEFQKITSAHNMDCLGICYAPSVDEVKMMDSGYMLLETCEQGRKQVLTAIPADDPSLNGGPIFRTTWSMSSDGGFGCKHVCSGQGH